MPSSLLLGTTVTISISQRKDTSEGARPGGSGWAILEDVGRGRYVTTLERLSARRTSPACEMGCWW